MRGEVHILVYCPIDTLQWGSTHSAMWQKRKTNKIDFNLSHKNVHDSIFWTDISHMLWHCWTPHVASYHISTETTSSFHMPPSPPPPSILFHLSHIQAPPKSPNVALRQDGFPSWCGIQFVLICPSGNLALSHVKILARFAFHRSARPASDTACM